MGLVAQLRSIQQNSDVDQLNRYTPDRPIVMDGSLSELVTQAINIAYSRKDTTTGEPFHGDANPNGEAPPGGGNIPNILNPDSPNTPAPIRPTLESMQQDANTEAVALSAALGRVISANDTKGIEGLQEDPLLIYAIPNDGVVTEEMNANIDAYHDSGATDIGDFVFVYSDTKDPTAQDGYRVYDLNQKVKDYEDRGAHVYPDMQSFLCDLPNIRRRK